MSLLSIPASPEQRIPAKRAQSLRDYDWTGAAPFILMHLVPLAAFWTGTRWQDWAVCVALFWIRMFAVTGVYHRYFSHRTYKTSRIMQFLLAMLAMSSSQKGVLWWASNHRNHHKNSDNELDPHSPRQQGVAYAHMGWLYDGTEQTNYERIKDFSKFPELVVLNKLWALPPTLLGIAVFYFLGWSGLLIGFALSTAVLWHATFTINSLCHVFGNTRFETGDDSRNNLWLALLTMGEGWHNNHHYFMGSTRQGFFWWEIDMTYYLLKVMSWFGLVWDLKEPPARVYEVAARNKKAAHQTDQVDEAA